MEKLDEFFKVRRNTVFERAKFNRRNQMQGESIEQYITALFNLRETCEFGDLADQLLRDRIIVGIRDTALAERLMLDAKLDLDKVMQLVRQKDAVHQHSKQLQGTRDDPIVVDYVGRSKGRYHNRSQTQRKEVKGQGQPKKSQKTTGGAKSSALCKRCGKDHSSDDKCPARGVTCFKCEKKGHFASVCLSRSVAATTKETSDTDAIFLGALQCNSKNQPNAWTTDLLLQGQNVTFKIDTGAEVTAINQYTLKRLPQCTPKPATRTLLGPSQQPLKVIGQFQASIAKAGDDKSSTQTVYVVKDLKVNLLGLPAITSLQLLSHVNSVEHPTAEHIQQRFPSLFHGLGNLGGEYRIKLQNDVHPYALFTPRNVPIPLRAQVKEELDRMEQLGVIKKVIEPTPWCAGMVVVPKKSGNVRICVDLKPLNEGVLRETYPIPPVDDTLAQLAGATIFSKVDANSGFWQIPLAEESQPLTTFITPQGRYCFRKLPFGISSAPELYQRRMSQILTGIDGVLCHIDDVLVSGATPAEHETRLTAVLTRLSTAGVTLNAGKCEFYKDSIRFLGHLIDKDGIHPDPDKVNAILKMEPPTNVTELRRFLGMANQLGKFTSQLASLTQPLRELLRAQRQWIWSTEQQKSFEQVKRELTRPTILTAYSPEAPTRVSADASSYGLGAVLLQQKDTHWRPVSYASRAMTNTEKNYAQIEKEALATTWACEKFATYILGRSFDIETDHKPLVPLFTSKHLDNLPPRILRFRLRMARYNYTIRHVPGKFLYTADTLSRAPLKIRDFDAEKLQDAVEDFVEAVTATLPASDQRLEEYRKAQREDPICSRVADYCLSGWPDKTNLETRVIPFWHEKNSLTIVNDILLHGSRIVVPLSLRNETLQRIHQGHQGIVRCRYRMRMSVWWPGVSKEISEMVEQCSACTKTATLKKEPLISSPVPEYPWQVIGSDLFELNGSTYLLVADYLSRYPELVKLTSTTSNSIISSLRAIFSRHGIPETMRSDNGPQYAAEEMEEFARNYGFNLITSSPRFPQSNGFIERMVKTVKQLLQHTPDPDLALLNYRTTPLPWCGYSPSELLMGRCLRNRLPHTKDHYIPSWNYLPDVRKREEKFKKKQKLDYDRRHRVRDLPELPEETTVWVKSGSSPVRGTVVSQATTPRSYLVRTPNNSTLRRNRFHLGAAPEPSTSKDTTSNSPVPRVIQTRSKTGTVVQPPTRFRDTSD